MAHQLREWMSETITRWGGTLEKRVSDNIRFRAQARYAAKYFSKDRTSRGIMKTRRRTRDLLKRVDDALLAKLELIALLQQYAVEKPSSMEFLRKYSLASIHHINEYYNGFGESWWNKVQNNMSYSVYLDTPIGILISFKGAPNAVVSFTPINHETIEIVQIQGVRPIRYKENREVGRGFARGLGCISWEEYLIHCVEMIAESCGFEKISVQGARNNHYCGSIPLKRLQERYDKPAQQRGFIQNSEGNWEKQLPEEQNERKKGWLSSVLSF